MSVTRSELFRFRLARALRRRTVRLDGSLFSIEPAFMRKILRRELFLGRYEQAERAVMREAVAPGDRVLEIGACYGVIATLAAATVGDTNVLTYEADSAREAVIRRNFALNGIAPGLRMRAVTADGRALTLHRSKFPQSSSIVSAPNSEAIRVPSDPLPEVLREFAPTLVCIDAEGAEVELIAASDFPGVGKIVVELHPRLVGAPAIAETEARLVSLGFQKQRQIQGVALFSR